MSDTILELMTRVDVEPVKTAMTEAATAVSNSTSKMKTDMASFNATSMAANEGVVDFMSKLPPAFIKVEAGGVFAFEQIKRRVIEATSEVGALRQEILTTDDTAKLAQLNAQLDQARARMTAARTEMRAMRLEMTETREKADLLGESVGVKIPGALGRMLGQMPQIQSIMNAAFAPIMVLFFVEAIEHAIEGIAKLARAIGGFGEEERKAFESALDHNQKLILSNLELKEKLEAISIIGKEGSTKYAAEAKNAAAAAVDQAAELARVNRELPKMQEQVNRLSLKKKIGLDPLDYAPWDIAFTFIKRGLDNTGEELEAAQAKLRRFNETRDQLEGKLRERPVEAGKAKAEEKVRGGDEAREVQRANVEAQKSLQTEYVNFYEQGLRRMYADDKITLADEVAGEKEAVLARLEIERTYAAQRKQLLAAEAAAHPGKNVQPQVIAVNTQLADAELRTRSEIAAIDQRFDKETEKQRDAVNLATVKAAKSAADSEIAVVEETSRRKFANGQIVLSELTAIEKAAANQRIDEQRAVVQEELRAAEQEPEKKKALIIKLNSDLENLERERITKIDAIDIEAENRKRAILSIEAESAKVHQQSLLEIDRIGIETRANLGLISNSQRLTQLKAITTQEYQLEREAIEKKKSLYAEGTTQFVEAEKELQQINDKYSKQMAEDDAKALKERLAAWEKFDHQIVDSFSGAVGEMLRHQKTFGQAMAAAWNTMVVDFAQAMARKLAQWILTHTLMKVVSQIFHLEELTKQTVATSAETGVVAAGQVAQVAAVATGQTAQTAAVTTGSSARAGVGLLEDIKSIGRAAATAAAHAFKWVMEEVPFPANVALAPVVAAGAFTAVMAFGSIASAAGGMEVTHDQVAALHKDEKVLPAAFSRDLSTAIGGSSSKGIGIPAIAGSLSSLGGGVSQLRSQMSMLQSSSASDSRSSSSSTTNKTVNSHASAAGGMDVTHDQMAMVHKDEIVLPESIAQNFRSMHGAAGAGGAAGAAGSSGGSGGFGSSVTNNKNVTQHIRPTIVVNHPGEKVSQEDIEKAVLKGVRRGAIQTSF